MKKKEQIPCKFDKVSNGEFVGINDGKVRDLGTDIASTVTARYYKGIAAHGDNMVLEIWTE